MPIYAVNNGDIVLATFYARIFDQRVLNTFHYEYQGPTVTAGDTLISQLATTLTAGGDSLAQLLRNVQTPNVLQVFLQVQVIYPVRRIYLRRPINLIGEAVDDPTFTANVNCTISRKGSLAGRGRTGRIQVAGLPQSFYNEGFLADGAYTALEPLRLYLSETVPASTGGGEFVPVVWSPATHAAGNAVTNATIQETIRVTRRRTIDVGE